jgi:hypothetical protein
MLQQAELFAERLNADAGPTRPHRRTAGSGWRSGARRRTADATRRRSYPEHGLPRSAARC